MSGIPELVSVVMPLYNAERYVREAIESILSQTYRNLELIVVDDGSMDRSIDIVTDLASRDVRIRLFRNEKNLGVAKTRNRAIREACGEYIACLDNDDVALPERLERQVDFMKAHPDHGLIASDVEIIDEFSRVFAKRSYPHTDQEIRKSMLRVNPVANPASMFRRSAFEDVGGRYDESVCPVEDYEFVLRMARKHKLANIDRVLTRYRISANQAKNYFLKRTIRMTLAIQKRAVSQGFADTWFNKGYRIGLSVLLRLPDRLILGLFKKLCYSTPARKAEAP